MAIVWVGKDIECDAADVASLPTNVPTHTKAFVNNTDDVMRFNGTSWVLYIANDKTETLTNKTIVGPTNLIQSSFIGPERWYIYRTGTGTTGPYYALNKRTGAVVYTGSSLDAVLDSVLVDVEAGDQGTVTSFISSGGHIYIDGTDVYYSCSAGFDGFTLPSTQSLRARPTPASLYQMDIPVMFLGFHHGMN